MAGDEGLAKAIAARRDARLRTQRGAGDLGLLTGDRVLGAFGAAQRQGADKSEDLLADAGKSRLSAALTGLKLAADKSGKANDIAEGLRKELMGNQVTKDMLLLATARQKMEKAYSSPGAASDLSLVYGLMRMMDPGSTVREGEFATAENASGVPSKILNIYNRVMKGERLHDTVRADFMNQANTLYSGQLERYEPLASQFGDLAERSGVPRGDVVLDLQLKLPTKKSERGPSVGPNGQPLEFIKDGKTFKLQPNGKYRAE